MTAEVINLETITRLDLPPERILNAALEAGLQCVVIVGFCEDGEEYFASSIAGGPEVLWHLERAKLKLLRTVDGEQE